MILGRLHDGADPLGRPDVAGIDPQARGAGLRRLDGALIVKVNVGHARILEALQDILNSKKS